MTLILSASVAPVDSERGRRQAPAHAIVLVAVIAMAHVTYQGYTRGAYGWLTRLATPPSNDAAVSGDIAWAAHALQKHDVHCVMDLSNNGAINGLLDLPSCTRFTYPVYALRTHENEMIEALRQDAVPSIIYSSTHWAYRIDSMPMSERLPKLDAFLRSEFPFEECGRAYCIRSRR